MFDIEKAKELCEKATPGPWIDFKDVCPYEGKVMAIPGDSITEICQDPESDDRPNDREFIAEARTLLPEAIAEIERLNGILQQYIYNAKMNDSLSEERKPPIDHGTVYRG